MADAWERDQQESAEGRVIRYGDKIGGVMILYGAGYKFGDTTSIWDREAETTATVTEE